MQLEYVFRHMEGSDRVRDFIGAKCETLRRFFSGNIKLHWTISREHDKSIVHVHVVGSDIDSFSEVEGDELFTVVEEAVEKLERQLQKKKEQRRDNHN